jgi:hypothetical protein
MGKRHDTPPSSSKTTLVVMAIGALLVAGLVGWALTRTVEPSPATETAAIATPTNSAGDTASSGFVPPTDTTPTSIPGTSVPMTTAPNATPPGVEPPDAHMQTPEKAAVPRIAVEDLHSKVNRGTAIVVDVRDQGSYERGHIPGALHIPLASIEANLSQLPKDKAIVTYCT